MLHSVIEALPILGRAVRADVYVASKEGRVIQGVDSVGSPVSEIPDGISSEVEPIMRGECSSKCVAFDGGTAWAAPLGDCWLIIVRDDDSLETDMQSILEMALPLIAEVAGGEAVLFDHGGRRVQSVNPDGTTNSGRIGLISKHAKEAMSTGRPVIGSSVSVPGAIAVRIPISSEIGLGFNNELVARQKHRLLQEVKKYQSARHNIDDIIGESAAIQSAKQLALKVARSSSRVVIQGETGTGKEVFAQAIHNASSRASGPFVALNCALLPPSLAESILVGYAEGAYTGSAKGGMAGVFEQADGGTLMLDEIGEMPVDLQAKLLRILEDSQVTRLGSTKTVGVDVRVIAASNRDLLQLIEEREFREDLYYRLQVMTLHIPPLRERREDIPALVAHFISAYNLLSGLSTTGIEDEAMEMLLGYSWPGNVRELKNAIEHAVNVTETDILTIGDFPDVIVQQMVGEDRTKLLRGSVLDSQKAETERQMIIEALAKADNNRTETAKMLGISVSTLWRKMKRLNIA